MTTVKPVIISHSKKDKTKILKTGKKKSGKTYPSEIERTYFIRK